MSAKALLAVIILVDMMMIGGYAYGASQPPKPCIQFNEMWDRAFAYVNATLDYPVNANAYTQLLSVVYSNVAYPFDLQHSGVFTITFEYGHYAQKTISGGYLLWGINDFNRTVSFSWVCKP